ncbi:DUF3892 domain-containing protein [Fibrella forsythiae]|uniref:DUF3892 domain-containing protein n=1 Tax=Fibrella forsythiae TaxID=2817061 RepID=A0ABS3JT97_9BACT|nr:DUF3892 domain-containing protein [Fibrella forsythiae]
MSNRITHIRKPNASSEVEHITDIKGSHTNGTITFQYTVAQVVQYLKDGYSFYVQVGSTQVSVTYQKSAAGREYIKTKPDSTQKDNLLSLPQF